MKPFNAFERGWLLVFWALGTIMVCLQAAWWAIPKNITGNDSERMEQASAIVLQAVQDAMAVLGPALSRWTAVGLLVLAGQWLIGYLVMAAFGAFVLHFGWRFWRSRRSPPVGNPEDSDRSGAP